MRAATATVLKSKVIQGQRRVTPTRITLCFYWAILVRLKATTCGLTHPLGTSTTANMPHEAPKKPDDTRHRACIDSTIRLGAAHAEG